MQTNNGFDFFPIHFDADGNLQQSSELDALKSDAASASDIILIAHGFRNDENDATGLYTDFLKTLRAHVDGPFKSALGAPRKFIVGGIYWPSKPFNEGDVFASSTTQGVDDDLLEKQQIRTKLIGLRDTVALPEQKSHIDAAIQLLDQVEGSGKAQDDFVNHVLSLVGDGDPDPTEGLDKLRSKAGSELLALLETPIRNPVPQTSDEGGVERLDDSMGGGDDGGGDEGGTQGLGSFFGSMFGRIGHFLNLTMWYVMKNRSGVVGMTGVSKTVRDLMTALPRVKVHLVGHSLGGRVMAGCAKSLAQDPVVNPASMTLLEAAFSHFGFSANNGQNQVGFFRDVINKQVIRGPFIATFSAQDSVVGTVYAIASRLAGDNLQAIGDENDPFGGLGRNGTQKTTEAFSPIKLHTAGTPYQFTVGKIVNLDGSGGLIKDHGDITNSDVTYAVASALALT